MLDKLRDIANQGLSGDVEASKGSIFDDVTRIVGLSKMDRTCFFVIRADMKAKESQGACARHPEIGSGQCWNAGEEAYQILVVK